ncbi:MAG: acyl-CoA dehydrogenase family protein [Candidatus Eremiobacteraeota bacterium]|nr:acyl-CoA dehydrogenase family protein [Candidatus Eremiobacteraeota bacterium]
MNYLLSEQEIEIREKAREFALKHVAPFVDELDREERFPNEILAKMAEEGFLGIFFPREYGGTGGGVVELCIATEEIARVCCGVSTSYAANALATFPILLFGTEEQKNKYLTPVAKGEKYAAFGLTEPNAGSDAGGIQTTAVQDGDYYILNGSKQWITNGGEADIYTIYAMTDKSRGARGITAFIIEKGTEGFTYGKKESKMGIRCSMTRELSFQDCRVPAENILGKKNMGFMVAMKTLDVSRPGVGAEALGVAQGILDRVLDYVSRAKKDERYYTSYQSIQGKLAEIATQVEAARALIYSVARAIDSGEKDITTQSAMSKLYATDVSVNAGKLGMEILGEDGIRRETGLEKMFRDAKITQIYEGTNEIQKGVIALGLIRAHRRKK